MDQEAVAYWDKTGKNGLAIVVLLVMSVSLLLVFGKTMPASGSPEEGYLLNGADGYWEYGGWRITASPFKCLYAEGTKPDCRTEITVENNGTPEELSCAFVFNEKPTKGKMYRLQPLTKQRQVVVGNTSIPENYTELGWKDVTSQLSFGWNGGRFYGAGTDTIAGSQKYLVEYTPAQTDTSKKWEMWCWGGTLDSPEKMIKLDPVWEGVDVDLSFGLVNYWDADGGTAGEDRQGKNLNLSATGGAETSVNGILGLGYAMNDSTTKYWNSSQTTTLMPLGNDDRTICIWQNLVASTGWEAIASFTTNTALDIGFMQDSLSDFISAMNTTAGGYDGTKGIDGRWEFRCITLDVPNNRTAFLNATMSTNWQQSQGAGTTGWVLLGTGPAFTDVGKGVIDEIGMWNRALNRTEISWLYNNGNGRNYSEINPPPSSANESIGRTAIAAGIAASTASSGTTYTDRQMYIYYLNGTQKLGTFDKVLSEGNQRWLFNYNTTGENYTNMESVSPAIHVWENTSLTASEITAQVSGFINSTDT